MIVSKRIEQESKSETEGRHRREGQQIGVASKTENYRQHRERAIGRQS